MALLAKMPEPKYIISIQKAETTPLTKHIQTYTHTPQPHQEKSTRPLPAREMLTRLLNAAKWSNLRKSKSPDLASPLFLLPRVLNLREICPKVLSTQVHEHPFCFFFWAPWSLPRASRRLHTHPTASIWWTKQSSGSQAEVCDTAHTTHMRGLAAAQGKQDDFEKQSYLHRPTLAQRKWNQFSSMDGSEMLSVAPAKCSLIPCKWLQDAWTLTLRPEHDGGPGQTVLRGRGERSTTRLSLLTIFSCSFKIKIINSAL